MFVTRKKLLGTWIKVKISNTAQRIRVKGEWQNCSFNLRSLPVVVLNLTFRKANILSLKRNLLS